MREGSSANAPTNGRRSKSALSDLPDDHDRGRWLRRGAGTENVRMSAMRTRSKAGSLGPETPKIVLPGAGQNDYHRHHHRAAPGIYR